MAGASLDLDRALGEIVRPAFTWRGVEYVGCMVSWAQVTAWDSRRIAIAKAFTRQQPDAEAQLAAFVGDMADALFPVTPAPLPVPWWRRWMPPVPVLTARDAVAEMPPALHVRLLASFWAALRTMLPPMGPTERAATTKSPKRQRNAQPPIGADDSPSDS